MGWLVCRAVGTIVSLQAATASAGTLSPAADDQRKTQALHDSFIDYGVRGGLSVSTLDTVVGFDQSSGPKASTEMLSAEGYFTVGHVMTAGLGVLQLASGSGGLDKNDNLSSFSTAGIALSVDLSPISVVAVDPHIGMTLAVSGTFVKVVRVGAQFSVDKFRVFADLTNTSFSSHGNLSFVETSGWGFGVTVAYSLGESPP